MTEIDTFDELKYTIARNENGVFYYNGNGKCHRDNDQPAIVWPDGSMEWWVNGERHRDNDQPAIMYVDGLMEWWMNGERHRDNDLPAAICSDGTKEWWVNGKLIKWQMP